LKSDNPGEQIRFYQSREKNVKLKQSKTQTRRRK